MRTVKIELAKAKDIQRALDWCLKHFEIPVPLPICYRDSLEELVKILDARLEE